jgi:pyruvate dehydrogenase phosphatase
MNHGANWVFAAASEGLRGWETSAFVFKSLIPTICNYLDTLITKYTTQLGDPEKMHPSTELKQEVPSEEFDKTIRKAFGDMEHGIVKQSREMIFSSPSKALNSYPLSSAIAGSTAMLAFYDDETRILKIANIGDGRAVLGRQAEREDGTQYLKVEVLTSEHTSTNPSEYARLHGAHSAEEVSIIQKYIGRDITRAFGLAMCKWSQDVQERIHKEYMGEPPLHGLSWTLTSDASSADEIQSQPYVTAEPDITTVRVEPDDFLILANKGLWNSLTNEEAVGLIGAWLIRRNYGLKGPITEQTEEHFVSRESLPVIFSDEFEDKTTWYKRWNLPKEFICVDSNAGVHLVRNALGGAHRAFTEGLLMVPYPFCANNR